MAFPIGLVGATLGSVFGMALSAGMLRIGRSVACAVLGLPLLLLGERTAPPRQLRRVATTIEVAAPPEVVWDHVVGFSDLPPPRELVFWLGIAHPTGARLIGRGVGAVRHCEFSTGPLVEPITSWEPPRRLGFDVIRQPPPMDEWSPYRHVHAPHLLGGTFASRRGEFLLEPMPGGSTRLRGTTWYEIDMAPASYWGLWSDIFIGRIHARVLAHVKRLSEADVRQAG
jgi:hypothetical protein